MGLIISYISAKNHKITIACTLNLIIAVESEIKKFIMFMMFMNILKS